LGGSENLPALLIAVDVDLLLGHFRHRNVLQWIFVKLFAINCQPKQSLQMPQFLCHSCLAVAAIKTLLAICFAMCQRDALKINVPNCPNEITHSPFSYAPGTFPDLIASPRQTVRQEVPESHRAGFNTTHPEFLFLLGLLLFGLSSVRMTKGFPFSLAVFILVTQDIREFPATTQWPFVELHQRFHIRSFLMLDSSHDPA
jgi:hypothetical protein